MILAITGHRPERINDESATINFLRERFETLAPDLVIVGMCKGVDVMAGNIAIDMNIPVVAAKPWKGIKGDASFDRVIANALEVVNVNESEKYPAPSVYRERNKYMVNRCDQLCAVWDGQKMGGTWQTIKYAQEKNKIVHVTILSV